MGKDIPENPPADNSVKVEGTAEEPSFSFEDAMVKFRAAEEALLEFKAAIADLVHDEASSLRGLADTTLAVFRAGKPGGA